MTAPDPTRRRFLRLAAAVPAAALSVAALSACTSNDPLAAQARAGDDKNYVAGDGSVTEYAKDQRKPPVSFTGTLYDGTTVDSKTFLGHVAVLNFWFAACAPCRVEAPSLKALHDEFAPQGVIFYGVNLRDEKGTAEAFEQTFAMPYPSFNDQDGRVLLAVSGVVPPGAVPTTLVLDKQGRVSARILGELDKGTLKALIQTAAAE
ncbi:TlpA family protein disulfide reductase [Sinomonas humi]|uniref:TlpA family protein disulfide reductase n=1 Tax=Sinomonas humi TaxID=1338436 RepID=UPI000690944C|nr:TlpA disulfide reductase family protein [Sinomonas humi]